ncbi:MAG: hypothetical protein MR828_11305, partial [Clostridiales bacterium]|nr:hypothetical protein [Clostridiales bacterium]
AALFKNPVFVTAASILSLFMGNYSSFSKGKQGKSASAKVGGGKIKRLPESRSRNPKGCVHRGLGQCLNKQKNHSFREGGMDGFSHLYIQMHCLPVVSGILDTSGKQCLWRAICEKRAFPLRRICAFSACWEISQAL